MAFLTLPPLPDYYVRHAHPTDGAVATIIFVLILKYTGVLKWSVSSPTSLLEFFKGEVQSSGAIDMVKDEAGALLAEEA